MFATLAMLAFFSSFIVLFVADTLGISKIFKCGEQILSSMFNITIILGLVYGVAAISSLFEIIS